MWNLKTNVVQDVMTGMENLISTEISNLKYNFTMRRDTLNFIGIWNKMITKKMEKLKLKSKWNVIGNFQLNFQC